jgi:hypothetical protein
MVLAVSSSLDPSVAIGQHRTKAKAPPRERRGFAGSGTVDPLKASKKAGGRHRKSAEAFLYPTTADCRSRFDLIVSICDVDRAWLRDALDKARPGWDRERLGKSDSKDKNSLDNSLKQKEAA